MKKSLNKKIWLIIGAVGLVSLAALFVFYYFNQSTKATDLSSPEVKPTAIYPRLIDGVLVDDESKVSPAVVAVMIDNQAEALPPVGINRASLVYEALAEGGITRFMAIFIVDENSDDYQIGPVRSARPYFVDWASEYQASYWHSGGSPEALALLTKTALVNDVNEFYNGSYFTRSSSRSRPHNLFTSLSEIRDYHVNKSLENKNEFRHWQFGPADPVVTPVITKISFNLSPYSVYQIDWHYDQDNNSYKRYQGNKIHLDSDGDQLTAKNIIFQFVDTITIDNIGRKKMTTTDSGRAVIINNGDMIDGYWQKDANNNRTIFYNNNNKEITLISGLTWLEVVPTDWPVDFSS